MKNKIKELIKSIILLAKKQLITLRNEYFK